VNRIFQRPFLKGEEMKNKRTKIVIGILASAGLLWILSLATAGNLEPGGPPAPTMKTLNEIYDAVIGASQREGYIGHFDVPGTSNMVCFMVPAGKKFVLLNLTFRYSNTSKKIAYITVNDNFLTGYPYLRSYTDPSGLIQTYADFPDRCVVVNAGETLKVINDESSSLKAMIVGYYHDVP
jgi:hypothetical protein